MAEERTPFCEALSRRILILDGAMGTMVQALGCQTENTDELNLSQPSLIGTILRQYAEVGADIITTNSFGCNALVQRRHKRSEDAPAMALAAARLARRAADEEYARRLASGENRPVYVAGSIGPTGLSLTMATDASDPSLRESDFLSFKEAAKAQIAALVEGGVDLIQLETCFDALNTKAAICALEELGCSLPVIISATVSDRSGRMLTGQTLEAFYHSVRHCPHLAAFGLNCALGAAAMRPLVEEVARFSDLPLVFYPNAGIPDEMGRYNESPEEMAAVMRSLAEEGLLNIAGGCCGTTPAHIRALTGALSGIEPRALVSGPAEQVLTVSGLEAYRVDAAVSFTNVGERANVTGSRKFARLIASEDYEQALSVAAAQVAGGANIIDVNMDDAMLDSKACMRTFLRYVASDPAVASAAIMIDSSNWDTLVEGLQNTPGRSIVNSISLKDGEEEFLRRARIIRSYGAVPIVMAFDEEGQAVTFERKIQIAERAYRLLTQKAGYRPFDIIFDLNILSIGTGIPEHARFAIDFIEGVRWVKNHLPGALTSGGVSNLSFAFRGNNAVREAMHSAFLYHAIKAGLDMAIVNPQMLQLYDEVEPHLLQAIEDVIFDRDEEATARLTDLASQLLQDAAAGAQASAGAAAGGGSVGGSSVGTLAGSSDGVITASERLQQAIIRGTNATLTEDTLAELERLGSAVAVVEGPLMEAMARVGERFAEGKMFLPQVVKSAKVMRQAVQVLEPYMGNPDGTEADGEGKEAVAAGDVQKSAGRKPRFVIATIRGDVHDIGKNITSIVLQCGGFEVFDMGVMVPCEDILAKAREVQADIIGVSGLITPSLYRMEELCQMMAREGFTTPLFVGGAAASAIHTAVKLAPLYPDVHYGADASVTAV
nr:homocysteine S-methyltransferase family protein [Bacteroidales bacterium]